MKILLDTHVLLWAAEGTLSRKTEELLINPENQLWYSVVSLWEIVIKRTVRKDFTVDPRQLQTALLQNGYRELNVRAEHIFPVENLPMLHKDPFDRILLAQSLEEQMPLLTADHHLLRYPAQIIDAR